MGIPPIEPALKQEPDSGAEVEEIDDLSEDALGWLGGQQVTTLSSDADALSGQVNQLATDAFSSPALQAAFSAPQTASSEDFTVNDAPKELDKIGQAVRDVLGAQNANDLNYNARTFVASVFAVTPDVSKPADLSFDVFARLADGESLDGLGLDATAEQNAKNIFDSFQKNAGDPLLTRISQVAAKRGDGPVDGLMSAQYLGPLSPASNYQPVIWARSSDKVWVAGQVAGRLSSGDSIAAIIADGPQLAWQRDAITLTPPVAGSCIGLGIGAWVKGIIPKP